MKKYWEGLSKTLKIRAVISRFGKEAIGGAEKHAYDVLQLLPDSWEVDVFTTTARDYITWKNYYKPGSEEIHRLRVHRFSVEEKRNIQKFNSYTDSLMAKFPNQTLQEESIWIDKQGPFAPDLLEAVKQDSEDVDLFLFFSYLYYPTLRLIGEFGKRSVLIPMFHDEFPAYFHSFKETFTNSIHYAFNAPEELDLFRNIYGFTPDHFAVIGTYVEFSEREDSESERLRKEKSTILKSLLSDEKSNPDTSTEYNIAIGRMDIGKGFHDLIQFYLDWVRESENPIPLKIIGKNPPGIIKKFQSEWIHFLGTVNEGEKHGLLRNAKILINPSFMESFSIVIMEAWMHSTPVFVNERSSVLKGHVLRSNGGLYFRDSESFGVGMEFLMKNPTLLKRMGKNGQKYHSLNFTKEIIQKKLVEFLEEAFYC